jgi:hypothetical protein
MTSKTIINTVSVPFAVLLKFAAAPKMKFRQSVKVGSQHLAVTLQKLPKAETVELGYNPANNSLVVRNDGMEVSLVAEK